MNFWVYSMGRTALYRYNRMSIIAYIIALKFSTLQWQTKPRCYTAIR